MSRAAIREGHKQDFLSTLIKMKTSGKDKKSGSGFLPRRRDVAGGGRRGGAYI